LQKRQVFDEPFCGGFDIGTNGLFINVGLLTAKIKDVVCGEKPFRG
jgi:hypothetical protein